MRCTCIVYLRFPMCWCSLCIVDAETNCKPGGIKSKAICIIAEFCRFVYFYSDLHLSRNKTRGSNCGIMQYNMFPFTYVLSFYAPKPVVVMQIIQSALSIIFLSLSCFQDHYHAKKENTAITLLFSLIVLTFLHDDDSYSIEVSSHD